MKKPIAFSVLISVFSLACGSNPPAAPRAPVESSPRATGPHTPLPPPDEATASNVSIAADIRSACGISDVEAFFPYDSANVRPQDHTILKKLADCFTTGPLKGREMRLIGHADPRGDGEYNHVLGQRRADNIKSAVAEAGMAATNITTTSRGEDDASGVDEASWAKDRRVEIVLGG
jgi:peptidoglycan-associated lipoprotein